MAEHYLFNIRLRCCQAYVQAILQRLPLMRFYSIHFLKHSFKGVFLSEHGEHMHGNVFSVPFSWGQATQKVLKLLAAQSAAIMSPTAWMSMSSL